MPCTDPTTGNLCLNSLVFRGITEISEDLLLNILEANLKTYLDWSFLNIGAWFDAEVGAGTVYGNTNSHSKLLLVEDPAYLPGQVWQGIRKDWVWETGCFMDTANPTLINGLTVDGTAHPYPGGDFIINYPEGTVVFDTPVATTSDVQIDYSYRYVQTYRANDSQWFSTLQYNTYNTSDKDIQRTADGEWSIAGTHRIQLPAIVVESTPKSRSKPLEIGNTQLVIEQDVSFYVLAENKNDRNKLLDIIRLQQGSTIVLYDTNEVAKNSKFPLDYNGDINPSGLMYPDLVENYSWKKCYLRDIRLFELESINPNFHQGLARATVEIIST